VRKYITNTERQRSKSQPDSAVNMNVSSLTDTQYEYWKRRALSYCRGKL